MANPRFVASPAARTYWATRAPAEPQAALAVALKKALATLSAQRIENAKDGQKKESEQEQYQPTAD